MDAKVLLCGLGYWGKNWLKTIQSSSYDLAAVVDPIVENIENVKIYKTIEDVEEDYTHAIIATPAATHISVYRKLKERFNLDDNKILVEKPVGTSYFDALEMKDCFHGFVWIYDDSYEIFKERKNSMGDIFMYESIRASMGPKIRTDISILEDYLFHDLYLFLDSFDFYDNDINIENAIFDNHFDSPVKASQVQIKMSSDLYSTRISMFSSWWYPRKERKITIVGTAGSLIWENNSIFINRSHYKKIKDVSEDEYRNKGYELKSYPLLQIDIQEKSKKSNLEKQLDNFINSKSSNTSELLMKTWSLVKRIHECSNE